MAKRDYYELLGVPKDSGSEAIKEAYRNLALKYHPDRNPGDKGAEEKFKEATEAYEVLSDSQKRATYDQFGFQGVEGTGFTWTDDLGRVQREFSDIFNQGYFDDLFDLFGMGTGARRRTQSFNRGDDLQVNISISLKEAAEGAQKEITVPRLTACSICNGSGAAPGSGKRACSQCGGAGQVRYTQGFFSISRTCNRCQGTGKVIENPCRNCRGTGRVREKERLQVTIPAGIESGSRLRIKEKGNVGPQGGPSGNLYLGVLIEPDAQFQREGTDILYDLFITFTESALGTEKEMPTLKGNVRMKIPPGTQTGTVLRLRGRGMPDVSGYRRGDQLVRVIVETPVGLGREERRLLEEFEKRTSQRSYPKSKPA